MDKIVVALPAPRLRLPLLRDLRRDGLDVRLRPLRRPHEEQHEVALVAGDDPGAGRHRRPRLGDHPQPARLGGVGSRRRLHRPARRLPHLQAPLPRRPARAGELRPQAVEASGRDARLRPHRGAPVQPHVQDAGRRARGRRARPRTCARRRRRASSSTSRTSSSSRAANRRSASRRSASRSATRSRPGNFLFRVREFEQMEMEFFVPPADAERVVSLLDRRALRLVSEATACARACCATVRTRPTSSRTTRARTTDIEYLYPIGWSGARGRRQPRRLRPHAAHASTPVRSSSSSATTASATRRT